MSRTTNALWWLGFVLRVAACAPLIFFFAPFALFVPLGLARGPIDASWGIAAALWLGGCFGLVGLLGSLFLKRTPKTRRQRVVLTGGLVAGLATLTPFCMETLGRSGPSRIGELSLHWVFLAPWLVGVYQLVRVLSDRSLPERAGSSDLSDPARAR